VSIEVKANIHGTITPPIISQVVRKLISIAGLPS
jgi:hypothetical protein